MIMMMVMIRAQSWVKGSQFIIYIYFKENPQQWDLYIPASVAAAKSLQSGLTLCDPTDGSPPGSPIPGILQARTLEWLAISFSNAWKWKVKVKSLSRVQLLATPWTTAYQAPLSVGFSRQEYWSGVPLPSPFQPDEKFPRYVSLWVPLTVFKHPHHLWRSGAYISDWARKIETVLCSPLIR